MTDQLAFVDESMRTGRYLLACVVVGADNAGQMRRSLRKLLLTSERRLHIRKSDRAQRLRILSTLATWEIDARVYVCRHSKSVGEEEARRLDLERIVGDLQASGRATSLFIERRAGADHRDRTTIIRSRRRQPALEFQHLWPTDDPLHWLPDCLAWAVGAGGEWKNLIDPVVEVVEVG